MFALLAAILSILGFATAAPATGACLCVTGNSVHIRDAANLQSHILASVTAGECFKFSGGTHTADGYTWYQLQDVHSHHNVWIASNFVQTSPDSHCSAAAAGTGKFATGIVSQECLQCICLQESGCRPLGCHFDVTSDSCGYFQIKDAYWKDCGSPGTSWHACANDLHCSSLCVQNYMKRYAAHYSCPLTCEGFAREHNGGPQGCHHTSTVGYWHGVQRHPGCSSVH